jgi:hypothetical protein
MKTRIILLAALALVACGDDDDPTPPIQINPDSSTPAPIDAGIDSSTPNPIDGSTLDSSAPVKPGAPNCFQGVPRSNLEFLNSCAEGYLTFDNKARLPGYDGTLPPLQ